jgi:uncharacterized membrane protein
MKPLAQVLVIAAAVWVAAIFLAPLAIGSTNQAARMCAVATYAAGSFVCHQLPDRSFHVAGRQLAVCGRCTGLYVSALAGALAALLISLRGKSSGVGTWRLSDRALLAIAAVPTALSWGLEHAGLAAQTNTIRAIAALPLGFAAAWVVVRMLSESPTQTARRKGVPYKSPSAV